MARLTFPNGEDRLVYTTPTSPNQPINNFNGLQLLVYLDEACATIADIRNADGSPNLTSTIVVGTDSQMPLFQGPDGAPFGTDTLFVRPSGATGNGQRIHSRYDDRIDGKLGTLETAADSNKLGGVVAALYSTTAQANAAYRPLAFRGAKAHASAAQTLTTSGTDYAVALDTESFDTNTLHDNATNNSRVVLDTVGYWLVQASCGFAANATGRRIVTIRLNGTTAKEVAAAPATAAGATYVPASVVVRATATTDYVEMLANQESGGSLNTGAGSEGLTWLSATFIGT